MGDVKNPNGAGPGWLPFDLLGAPVPANRGMKGRPQHAPSAENLEKAVLLYAHRKTDLEVAAAIGITIPTLKAHYFSSAELQAIRRNARMFVEGELLARLNRDSLNGKTGATEKLLKRLDKAGLSAVSDRIKDRKGKEVKPVVVGKKEGALQNAAKAAGLFAKRTPPEALTH